MLTVTELIGGYTREMPVLKNLTFEVARGELFGILGPNGSGKTTLLQMMSGILPYHSGEIMLKGKRLQDYRTKELARVIAVLPQHSTQAFSYTVKETVSLGRYAHQKGLLQSWSTEDEEVVQKVMKQTGVTQFQHISFEQLSGGEKQRVLLAQSLAQEPEILFLDEPTNHLDLSYQKELLDLMKRWTKKKDLTVISIFHDLNLASLYCDRLLLLDKGKIQINDKPNEVLKRERIQAIYQTEIENRPHPNLPKPQLFIVPAHLAEEQEALVINEQYLEVTDKWLVLKLPIPLKTLSSGVTGTENGWYKTFVNCHAKLTYDCKNPRKEMIGYLSSEGFNPSETVGMITDVDVQTVTACFYEEDNISTFIVVTAGKGDVVDTSRVVPSIHTWVFVNGCLSEGVFIQGLITATEAKVKALHDCGAETNTPSTEASKDSILIAASQRGTNIRHGESMASLDKLVGTGVYECTLLAMKNSGWKDG
ncbi:ATP-binding cassette domain-containing protein [Peribacillus loiseleuriae]|uniref:Iron ABC transporter ATPase n=1 Tax=Peribacillus loiseleuriae TaxID=1679170 RepID=A0A0K9GZG0_9BACI|nr:ATP-binding cassette domain-containing protein [Peribacillus loiseleuriae]KMY52033.1 iron ABC transporter ATPase [Peribacillus loiseleuriae]